MTVRIVGQAAREPGYRVISLAGCCARVYTFTRIYMLYSVFAICILHPDRMSRISTYIMNGFSKSLPPPPPLPILTPYYTSHIRPSLYRYYMWSCRYTKGTYLYSVYNTGIIRAV